MISFEYWYTISEHYGVYIAFLVLSIGIHYLLFRKQVYNIFDPFLLPVITNVFSVALVFFMYWMDDIKVYYFKSFVLTQTSLYIGFLVTINSLRKRLKGRVIASSTAPKLSDSGSTVMRVKIFLFVAFVFYMLSIVFIYSLKGIPLLRLSRLGAFANSGGLGIIERINEVSLFFVVFGGIALLYLIYRKFGSIRPNRRNINTLTYLFLGFGFLLITLFLSGSKGSFLVVFVTVFVFAYVFIYRGRWKGIGFFGGKAGMAAIVVLLIAAFFIIVIQRGGTDTGAASNAIMHLANRFVYYGDIYVNAYISDTIKELSGTNPFVGLFGGFLSTFRLFPVDDLYVSMGHQFTLILYPELEIMTGPNPRHNVIGLHYFGFYFSAVYSFILGIGIAFARYHLLKPRTINKDFDLSLFSMFFAWRLLTIDSDIELALSRIASLLIVAPFIIFLSRMIYGALANERCDSPFRTFGVPTKP